MQNEVVQDDAATKTSFEGHPQKVSQEGENQKKLVFSLTGRPRALKTVEIDSFNLAMSLKGIDVDVDVVELAEVSSSWRKTSLRWRRFLLFTRIQHSTFK